MPPPRRYRRHDISALGRTIQQNPVCGPAGAVTMSCPSCGYVAGSGYYTPCPMCGHMAPWGQSLGIYSPRALAAETQVTPPYPVPPSPYRAPDPPHPLPRLFNVQIPEPEEPKANSGYHVNRLLTAYPSSSSQAPYKQEAPGGHWPQEPYEYTIQSQYGGPFSSHHSVPTPKTLRPDAKTFIASGPGGFVPPSVADPDKYHQSSAEAKQMSYPNSTCLSSEKRIESTTNVAIPSNAYQAYPNNQEPTGNSNDGHFARQPPSFPDHISYASSGELYDSSNRD
jgi:hypothetical protein